ncbi:regulator of cell cycle RGCC-like isoform X2 [Centropristis striata]|uniref:regulator of cell cycle RGCC-like isoform X2 n=1 Tax=Centropristis striata TaxID=184440 RepID=UPI0027E1E08D|nr:regulator of cell cycle RGCC-like isoform X2 [Centropristis striata]
MDHNQQILMGEETNYLELDELLQEFQDVVEELKAPSQSKPHAYNHVLHEAKSRTGLVDDSGVEDSDYCSEASLGNSLNTSEEELHTAGITLAPKAKLGDTRELESFIDMLDRELAGGYLRELHPLSLNLFFIHFTLKLTSKQASRLQCAIVVETQIKCMFCYTLKNRVRISLVSALYYYPPPPSHISLSTFCV